MQYKSVKGFSGAAQLGLLMVFLGLGFILAGGVQLILSFKMMPPGTGLKDMEVALIKAMKDPKNVSYARLAQISGTFFLFFIPAALYSWIANGRNKFWLGFNTNVNIYQLMIGFLIIFTANVMAAPLAEISKVVIAQFPSVDIMAKKLEAAYNDQVITLSNLRSWPEFLMALVIMAFFPALFEEVFFRGALQNLLVKWWRQPIWAIIFTSLLFSVIHMSFYLFLSRAVLGFVLGLMYHKSKNIWVNVIAHFLNNAIAVAGLFSMSKSNKKMNIDDLESKTEWWIGMLALVMVFFLFRFLDRYSLKNRLKIHAKEQLLLSVENTSNPFAKTEMN